MNTLSTATHNSRQKWFYLGLVFLFNMISILDRINISVVAPHIMKEFNFDAAVMGMIMSAFFWSYTVCQIPAGWFLDKIGLRKGLIIVFICWGIFTITTGFVSGIIGLILVRILLGASEAAIYPSNIKFINTWFNSSERATCMGILSSSVNLGMAGATWFVATIALTYGWRASFVIAGIISIVFIPIWYYFYHDKKPLATSSYPESPTTASAPCAVNDCNISILTLLKNRNILGLTISFFGTNYSLFFFLTWLPSYFNTKWQMNLMETGTFTALVFLTGAFGKPTIGWLCDYTIKRGWSPTKARKVFLVVLNLTAACIALAVLSPTPLIAAIIFGIAEITGQASSGICGATAADISSPSIAAKVGGIMNTAAGLGGVLAPALTGYLLLISGNNFYWPLVTAGVIMIISALSIIFIMGEVKPITEKNSPSLNNSVKA